MHFQLQLDPSYTLDMYNPNINTNVRAMNAPTINTAKKVPLEEWMSS